MFLTAETLSIDDEHEGPVWPAPCHRYQLAGGKPVEIRIAEKRDVGAELSDRRSIPAGCAPTLRHQGKKSVLRTRAESKFGSSFMWCGTRVWWGIAGAAGHCWTAAVTRGLRCRWYNVGGVARFLSPDLCSQNVRILSRSGGEDAAAGFRHAREAQVLSVYTVLTIRANGNVRSDYRAEHSSRGVTHAGPVHNGPGGRKMDRVAFQIRFRTTTALAAVR